MEQGGVTEYGLATLAKSYCSHFFVSKMNIQ